MRPNERRDSGQHDLLRSRLDQIVDPRHPLVQLLAALLAVPRAAVRRELMAGLAILKHTYVLLEEVLCERWLRTQLFCGEEFFPWLSCVLGHRACRDNHSVLYQRIPRLFADPALARGDDRYARLMRAPGGVELLILDDWGTSAARSRATSRLP